MRGKINLIVVGAGTTGCHVLHAMDGIDFSHDVKVIPMDRISELDGLDISQSDGMASIEMKQMKEILKEFHIEKLPEIDMPLIPHEPRRIFRQHNHVKKNKKRR